MGWWSRMFPALEIGSSYEEIATSNRDAAKTLTRAEALRRIEASLPQQPTVAALRDELLTLVRAPVAHTDAAAARQRGHALLAEMLRTTGFLVRPGTVEEVWMLEGLIDRALAP